MKIIVHRFKNNKVGYSTENISLQLNKEEAIETEEFEADENKAREFFNEPDRFEVKKGRILTKVNRPPKSHGKLDKPDVK